MKTSSGLILLFAAAIGLAACSSRESSLVRDGQHPAAVIPKRQQQVSPLRKKVVSLLEKKNYRQAIELMNGKNREGLEREYILALNGMLEEGNDAFSSGDNAVAALNFKGVLNAYPVEHSLRDRICHDPKRIRALLEACVNRMMEQGLEEYRHGNLESAIRKWKELLAISPGHQEAKKALDTATVQLQTLQRMNDK
jgi:hypothetical protein